MSITKQSSYEFDDEATKLLEKALSSFDGIILGKNFIFIRVEGKVDRNR